MKSAPRYSLLILPALAATSWLIAQVTAPAGKRNALENRLAQALKQFPDADENQDGTLTVEEALRYVAAHPEAKEQFLAKAGAAKSKSKPAHFPPGAEGVKVFVCAHSYMIYTADMLPAICRPAGVPHLFAGQQMIGGSQVIQHWNLPDEKNEARKALREGIVDVLTLSPHLILPDDGITHYTKLGLEKNPALRVLVQASWAPHDGRTGPFSNSMRDAVSTAELRQMRDTHHNGWLKRLEDQVAKLNASIEKQAVHIIPVSAAVYALRETVAAGGAPGLGRQSQLFRDDHGHPSPVLALLVTYCHFAAIHQRTPVGLRVPDSLKSHPEAEALNRLLQEIAWETVTSYPMSGVRA